METQHLEWKLSQIPDQMKESLDEIVKQNGKNGETIPSFFRNGMWFFLDIYHRKTYFEKYPPKLWELIRVPYFNAESSQISMNSSKSAEQIVTLFDYLRDKSMNTGNVTKDDCYLIWVSSSLPLEAVTQMIERLCLQWDADQKELGFCGKEIQKRLRLGKKQIVLTGAPGTGKTHAVKAYVRAKIKENHSSASAEELEAAMKEYTDLVQFHASYDYTDLIEGLRPVVIGMEDSKPITQFVRIDGRFKSFCRKAAKAYDAATDKAAAPLYYFIIDEINRADLSRVFGEIMHCLDEDYRGRAHAIHTQYSNLPTYQRKENEDLFSAMKVEDDVFADGFFIPENVILLATMNDIDRSVETFDFALRRRFQWIGIRAEDTMQEALPADVYAAVHDRAAALNGVIAGATEFHLGEDYQLGQSYFRDYLSLRCTVSDSTDEKDYADFYFTSVLRPILCEYVRGRKNAEDLINACRSAFVTCSPDQKSGDASGTDETA